MGLSGHKALIAVEYALREIANDLDELVTGYGDEPYVTDTEKLVNKISEIIHKAADGMQAHFDSFHD